MEENKELIEKIISELDKFKLIDVISSVFYYYRITGSYDNMLSPAELEYIIDIIYKTKSLYSRQPTRDDVMNIILLANNIVVEKGDMDLKEGENIISSQARADFILSKEDTEYRSIGFEYLNLFNVMEYFFKTYYSFKIEDFLRFTTRIQIQYANRMLLLQKVLEKSNKSIEREVLIDYLLNCNCPILTFNENTLANSQEEVIAIKSVLEKFSVNEELCNQKDFESYPIFKKGNTYILSSLITLLYKAKHIFERDIYKNKILASMYAKKKGEYLEILTQDVISEILKDAKIFPNVQYRENKMNRECDLLVIYDKVILIIEIKGRAFKEISKEGAKTYLDQDLNDNIYKAYNQATRMEKYLLDNQNVSLRYGSLNTYLKIYNTNKFKIFKIGITLENFRKYAVQYAEFNNQLKPDMVFLNINDLKFMSKYFKYQTEFIHYISQRIKTNKYINKFYWYDELYLFSDYKMYNLQRILNNDHTVKIYDTGRYKLFDLRFDTDKKEELLKGVTYSPMDKLIRQMESEKLPTYSLTILELLDLDYNAQKYIFDQLKVARLKAKEEGQSMLAGIAVDGTRDAKAMFVILGVTSEKEKKTSLESIIIFGSMLKRKHPNSEVLGFLNNIEDSEEKITTCLKILDPKPEFDKSLEKIQELKDIIMKL